MHKHEESNRSIEMTCLKPKIVASKCWIRSETGSTVSRRKHSTAPEKLRGDRNKWFFDSLNTSHRHYLSLLWRIMVTAVAICIHTSCSRCGRWDVNEWGRNWSGVTVNDTLVTLYQKKRRKNEVEWTRIAEITTTELLTVNEACKINGYVLTYGTFNRGNLALSFSSPVAPHKWPKD